MPVDLGDGGQQPSEINLVVDPGTAGTVLALWAEAAPAAGSPAHVYARSLQPGQAWSTRTMLDDGAMRAIVPLAAFDGQGNAVAAYARDTATMNVGEVHARRWSPGGGWASDITITTEARSSYSESIGVASDGSALIVWQKADAASLGSDLYVTPLTGDQVGTAEMIGVGQTPRIGVAASGVAIAMWVDVSSTFTGYARSRDATGNWSNQVQVTPTADIQFYSAFASNAAGQAIVLWRTGSGTGLSVARYEPATGWATPQPFASTTYTDFDLVASMAGDGTAITAWDDQEGSSDSVVGHILSSTFAPAATATDPVTLDELPNPFPLGYSAKVYASPGGQGIAVWVSSDGTNDTMWVARWSRSGGWQAPQAVWTAYAILEPIAVIDAQGRGTVAWEEYESLTPENGRARAAALP
jgi:hypothetical protein